MASLYPDRSQHLYERAGGITYDITGDHPSTFAGIDATASKVYFTSVDQLTDDDHDTSVDLYRWQLSSDSLQRISKGLDGTGDTDNCSPTETSPGSGVGWTQKCDVGLISFERFSHAAAGLGGNGHSDNSVARNSGDIYFYSPEQLDGDRGARNARNLYVFHGGKVQHVATLQTGGYCILEIVNPEPWYACTDGPVGRMNVSADGEHVAFVTQSRLTGYDNQDIPEMYLYEPGTRKLECASCLPGGKTPTAPVSASQNGLFMTNDGRPFFSTEDPLTSRDTNRTVDVYEFVEGRAQLISPGVGDSTHSIDQAGLVFRSRPGLVGVSADGADVYFATYEKLVGQDANGDELKVYDARVNGGFPFSPPPAPCPSADECHGASSRTPDQVEIGTGAYLGEEEANRGKKPKKKSKGRCRKKAHRNARCKRHRSRAHHRRVRRESR
jgi:hypothetical protein